MTEPVSITTAAPSASAAEAQVEIVLGNGRRVLVPASIDRDALARASAGSGQDMIAFPAAAKVWIAGGVTDMRVASGFSNRRRNRWRP